MTAGEVFQCQRRADSRRADSPPVAATLTTPGPGIRAVGPARATWVPRCRTHRKIKQLPGWTLTQPEPGVFHLTTPAGRTYITRPDTYPT